MSLQRALLLLIAAVLAAALVPAGLLLQHRLTDAIESQTRADLALAPSLMAERQAHARDALMMHAKDIAATAGLADALANGDTARAVALVQQARGSYGEDAVLVTAEGVALVGPRPPDALLEATRDGEMPVEVVPNGVELQNLALAPVMGAAGTVGAAGVVSSVGIAEAGALAGLTRSDILILSRDGGITTTTIAADDTAAIATVARGWLDAGVIDQPRSDGDHRLITGAPLGGAGMVFFVRDLDRDMAVLSGLRRIAGLSLIVALAFALVLGGVVAHALGRQVRALASAADRLAAGDFHAPLERPVISEIGRMADAFASMRSSLAARLEELEHVNRELADRQARLSALQSELIQRDRLAAAGQLVAQLAHEIRNPVANVRNCLEVIRRRLRDDEETREFADLAIDELLRMHELAEQMLDLHRPRDIEARTADVLAGAGEVASLLRVGAPDGLAIDVEGEPDVVAAIGPDALKQVLLNLAHNAREAMRERGRLEFAVAASGGMAVLEVRDTGPGIPSGILPRIFDPFFTTKGAVHGVGLGLFVAEGIVRSNGGRITAANRKDGTGARFVIELPLAAIEEPTPTEMAG